MKSFKINLYIFFILISPLFILSCSDDKDDPQPTPTPTEDVYFDIWVSTSGNASMGGNGTLLVRSVEDLDTDETIGFSGKGADVTAKLFLESMIKDKYYYQIPKEKDRFGKYSIEASGVKIIKEVSFAKNTYKDRRYSHTWIDENTLVILSTNGDSDKVIWTKINTSDMTIISESTLDGLTSLEKYSTSGLATYRSSDNKILYAYCHGTTKSRDGIHIAFINPSDMKVEKNIFDQRAPFMSGTAYGELLQDKVFFDSNGDYYLTCGTPIPNSAGTTQQTGTLLRIKKGETEFDKTYIGFADDKHPLGKIVTAQHISNGKALLCIQDPEHTKAAGWGTNDYNCYYGILDLATDNFTELEIPYSTGVLTQRSQIINNKAYIGTNPQNTSPSIYIYDIATSKLNKGVTIQEGFSFDRIVTLNNK